MLLIIVNFISSTPRAETAPIASVRPSSSIPLDANHTPVSSSLVKRGEGMPGYVSIRDAASPSQKAATRESVGCVVHRSVYVPYMCLKMKNPAGRTIRKETGVGGVGGGGRSAFDVCGA